MGDVDAFSIPGLKCYFSSNDHPPPHFEVLKRGHWVIRVYFLRSGKVRGLNWVYKNRWRGNPTGAEEAAILEMVLAHRRGLLREWNEKVCYARENKKKNESTKNPGGKRRG